MVGEKAGLLVLRESTAFQIGRSVIIESLSIHDWVKQATYTNI
jgi:hypothetical protein